MLASVARVSSSSLLLPLPVFMFLYLVSPWDDLCLFPEPPDEANKGDDEND